MSTIILSRLSSSAAESDPWIAAVSGDYSVPRDAVVFAGEGLCGERVAFWIGADGGGFGAIDSDPDGYVELSAAMARGDYGYSGSHGGVDEYEFEPGTFSAAERAGRELDVAAQLSFGGL